MFAGAALLLTLPLTWAQSVPINTEPPPSRSNDACSNAYFEMVTLQRLKQTFGCEEHHRREEMSATCAQSQCFKMLSPGGAARMSCGFSVLSEARQKYPDEVECLMETSSAACGFGVYGISVGGDRNTKKCVCQVLDQQIDDYLAQAKQICPENAVSLLCIPTMLQAITACSWPSISDTAECVERRLGSGTIKGASIPACYLHSCNYLQHVFGIQLQNCVCRESESNKQFRRREWFVFENQKQNTDDVQRHEIIAARDISLTLAPGQVTLDDAEYTDFSDPQSCNRFVRCYNNGPCFNSTDGGLCPSGEHFHANKGNPSENGCYPQEDVDCKGVPVTNDSPGKVPTCFSGNHDFSDVNVAGDSAMTAFRIFLDHQGYVGAIQFQYEGRWGTRWGLLESENEAAPYEITLTPSENIRSISGETINFETIDQHVATLNFTIVDNSNGRVWSQNFGEIPAGIPATPWTLSYPLNSEPTEGCPMKYSCGSLTDGKIQVLTVHWNECLYSNNPFSAAFGRVSQSSFNSNIRTNSFNSIQNRPQNIFFSG